MKITDRFLYSIAPRLSADAAAMWAPLLDAAREQWVGEDPRHFAMWLAQLAHESGEFRHVLELDTGEAYEGRESLGNTEPGDGPRFKGRGLIQITGRYNYTRCAEALGLPLLEQPELLERPEYAAQSAGWFWSYAKCGELMQSKDPLLAVTKRINGGTNGLESRRKYWNRALLALENGGVSIRPMNEEAPVAASNEEPQPAPVKETPMPAPIVGAVAAAIVPELLKILPWYSSGSENAERNIKAVQQIAPVVIEAAKKASGETGVAEAAQAVVNKPEVRQAYVQQMSIKWQELSPLLQYEEASRKEARDFGDRMTSTGPTWRQVGYGLMMATLAIGIVIGGGALMGYILIGTDTDAATKAQILDYYKAVGYIVVGYVFGSSVSSGRKDSALIATVEHQQHPRR